MPAVVSSAASDEAPQTDSAYLDIENISVGYGQAPVLDDLSLRMARGEFVSLLGPSGCGKTTLLRVVAGLINPMRGGIRIEGHDIARLPVHRRRLGFVFQNYALFPNLDVAGNVAFGLRAQGASKAEVEVKVKDALTLVRMSEFADRSVRQLSGGQQQRIAVARALAVQPRILLLDEPFSALDRQLRETVQIELRRLLRGLGITAIFVTHDQDEALLMSDRIAVMNAGRIEQLDSVTQIHARPATPFVLDFVGLATKFNGHVSGSIDRAVIVDTAAGKIQAHGSFLTGSKVLVAVRAERIRIAGTAMPGENTVELPLIDVIYRGSRQVLEFGVTQGDQAIVEVSGRMEEFPIGQKIALRWAIEDTLIYPALDDPLALGRAEHA